MTVLSGGRFLCYNRIMRTDYLNPQIYNRLYGVMTYENVLALRISLETGLRIDDILSLRAEQLKGRTLRGVAEKTGKPYKKVISGDLASRLKALNRHGYIFPHRTKKGEHRTRQAVWSNMKKAARLLGVELNAAPHSARKTYAVELLHDKGLDAVQRELQHDRVSTSILYAFADLLTGSGNENKMGNICINAADIETIAAIIAAKVVEFLEKQKTLL